MGVSSFHQWCAMDASLHQGEKSMGSRTYQVQRRQFYCCASGGVGTLDHLYDGITTGGASAVLAASIFHYGEHSIKDAKEYLNSKKVPVRL